MSFDLKIAGGTIVDGTGKPGFVGDIGIKGGKIVSVGKANGPATTTIDATGKVVSPGFVDVHTHYDAQILWDRMLSISPWHGVTTTVISNCGFGVAPTRAAHRRLILQTLEKVEGMSLDALQAGLGEAWASPSAGRPAAMFSERRISCSRPRAKTVSSPLIFSPPVAARRAETGMRGAISSQVDFSET